MSDSEIKAWKVKERKKRKALKQKENRKTRKKRFKEIQSMMKTLPNVDEALSKTDEICKSNNSANDASKGVTNRNHQLVQVKETDRKDDAVKSPPDDGTGNVLNMSPVLIKSSDQDDTRRDLVPSGVFPAVFQCKIADAHRKKLEAEVLSEEYEFNIFDVIIGNIELLEERPVTTHVFDRRFIPVEDSSIAENDVSVIDDGSYLNNELLG